MRAPNLRPSGLLFNIAELLVRNDLDYFATFVEDPANIKLDPEGHSEYGWFAEDELINSVTDDKGLDNIEFVATKKAFAVLRGESPKF
jgi:hypothetical protein